MTKFNMRDKRGPRTPAAGILTKTPQPVGHTYNGAPGYQYDTLSELFLHSCTSMFAEDSFYEKGGKRAERFVKLVHDAAQEGHIEWLQRFFPWLRNQANMRTAAIVGAVETTRIMVALGVPGGRELINSVLTRADEPGEMWAYYTSVYGRHVPQPIKRGIADAVAGRLYKEHTALKYDTASKGLRFGDVIELTHPAPQHPAQGDLFKFLVSRAHHRDVTDDHPIPATLSMFIANAALRAQAAQRPELLLNTARLGQAGMTWEDVLSLAGSKVPKKDLWEAMIPAMGYMALLRNLRNFDEARVKSDTVALVKQKLRSPAEVAMSRQLPMRFLPAYRAVPSSQWAQPLEEALNLSLTSLPMFEGRTLILIDTSGSMDDLMSGRSQLKRVDAAIMFGLALAQRCGIVDVVSFSSSTKVFPAVKGESLLKGIDRFMAGGFNMRGGTSTEAAVAKHYNGHDRVIILTDEQADNCMSTGMGGVFGRVPQDKMCITFNLAGFPQGHAPVNGKTRVTIGGLSDAAFRLLPALEGHGRGEWPF